MQYTAAKIFSKERFTIEDHAGTRQFEVHRIYGLDGNSLSLRDLDGKELAAIKPRHAPARFEISTSAQVITVHHNGWFGRRYSIDGPLGELSTTVSDFGAQSYELIGGDRPRAIVSRPQISQQSITIDVPDGEDVVSLLAVVLAIETIRDDRRQAQDSIPYVRLILRLIN